MKLAANALNWCVGEMEPRYRLMSTLGVRNLSGYNTKVVEAEENRQATHQSVFVTPEAPKPSEDVIVVVIGDRQEARGTDRAHLAKGARCGIHLILATHASTSSPDRSRPTFLRASRFRSPARSTRVL